MSGMFDPLKNDDFTVLVRGTEDTTSQGPPTNIIFAIATELAVCALLFVSSSKMLHAVGYVLGALVVAVTAVMYRVIDKKRRRSPRYVTFSSRSHMVTGGLVCGILLAMGHAYFYTSSVVVL